jgi:hypothetical protein
VAHVNATQPYMYYWRTLQKPITLTNSALFSIGDIYVIALQSYVAISNSFHSMPWTFWKAHKVKW